MACNSQMGLVAPLVHHFAILKFFEVVSLSGTSGAVADKGEDYVYSQAGVMSMAATDEHSGMDKTTTQGFRLFSDKRHSY